MTTSAQGAVAKVLSNIQVEGGLRGTDIANVVDVSKATVSRWKSGQMRPQPKHELILSDLHYVVGRLQEFYSTDEIRAWLYARHPQLAGERAIDLIHDDRTQEVLAVLERLDSGAYL
ncbi:antitoxin Xre/MbcA/ParS toxin-binding domain-containing protein [Acuticoccus sediminis]|jgi:transcriptional regulator with XRE-family HTH domain|uniref:antitoxin Xre/MbcA/ParS toxin-binding domain-containing protein n=1 Tax=Acuticoccus sediminis TaxID=2184697 RepID=UPI001CFCBB54|nr:antitoxin Xre/MbcA/ParS toxin-binding domain-containing protein [Acuticoccus sediminis]